MHKTDKLEKLIIEGIEEKKGDKIAIINLSKFEMAGAPKLIICQGRSTSNVSAIADSIREYVQKHNGPKPYNYDGYRNCQWIVIDYGEIMVHVFLPEQRELYNIEGLWADAPITYIEEK